MGFEILLVDDSSIIRRAEARMIRMAGFEDATLFEAGNGAEALEILKDHVVDLILCDINMPDMGGVELLQILRKNQDLAQVPLVVVTSDHTEARANQMIELGAKAYLTKPLRPETICTMLHDILGEPV